jgi:small nuclear ribonucleoprotein (snRNP)-like protein
MKTMLKFSVKIDDDNHTLSKENGISFDKIAVFLKDLYDAIETKLGIKCTLGEIRGNCYALDFYTEDEKMHDNFVMVHKNLEQHSEIDLKDKEQKYAKTLKGILGDKFYLKAYDKTGFEIAKLRSISIAQEIEHYYNTQLVYGIFSEHGSKSLKSKSHILISGLEFKIYINDEQDLSLKPYYKTHKLRFRLRQKISTKDGHIISAELIEFDPLSNLNLLENINSLDVKNLKIIFNQVYGG